MRDHPSVGARRALFVSIASAALCACSTSNGDNGDNRDAGSDSSHSPSSDFDGGIKRGPDGGTRGVPDASQGSDDCPILSQLNTAVSSSDVHRGKDDNGVYFFTWNLTLHETPLHVVRVLIDEPVPLSSALDLAKGCKSGSHYCGLLQVNATRAPGSAGAVGSNITLQPTSGTLTISLASAANGNFKAKITASNWRDPNQPTGCVVDLPEFNIDLPVQAN